MNEKKAQVEDLQLQLGKREEELTQAFMRIDEEAASMLFIIFLCGNICYLVYKHKYCLQAKPNLKRLLEN